MGTELMLAQTGASLERIADALEKLAGAQERVADALENVTWCNEDGRRLGVVVRGSLATYEQNQTFA